MRLTAFGHAQAPAFSPDATQIAFEGSGGGWVFILNPSGGISQSIASAHYPTWAPDATRIAFSTGPSGIICAPYVPFPCGYLGVYSVNLDGTGLTRITAGD